MKQDVRIVLCIANVFYGRIAGCVGAFREINQTLCAFQRQPRAKSAKAGIDHCTDHDDGDADHDSSFSGIHIIRCLFRQNSYIDRVLQESS